MTRIRSTGLAPTGSAAWASSHTLAISPGGRHGVFASPESHSSSATCSNERKRASSVASRPR